ncbi:hypothetical protein [Duganella sp. FT27W]|uniref:hypothetical protein n=1 Tax=Duganella sp. FT27W TaxID=2654636 RepID=UPI00128AE62E|nr:hypothetical protein [Duganella sp. FT27W]MPQ56271.1 hypothetical protein [Duganella sp. FT27W]
MREAIERAAISAATLPQDNAHGQDDDIDAGVEMSHLECWAEGLVHMDAHARRAPRRMRYHD